MDGDERERIGAELANLRANIDRRKAEMQSMLDRERDLHLSLAPHQPGDIIGVYTAPSTVREGIVQEVRPWGRHGLSYMYVVGLERTVRNGNAGKYRKKGRIVYPDEVVTRGAT